MPDPAGNAGPPGAYPARDGHTRFRVWAPEARSVELVIDEHGALRRLPLTQMKHGYHETVAPAPPGARYAYTVDGEGPWPDPCSRSQPDGPHGFSAVVDPGGFDWTDGAWRGISLHGQVLYELHVGTFTAAGTFDAAIGELPRLARLGVTAIELMPVAEFPGRFNWGYDGVQLFAPFHGYGGPEAMARFVDRAHALGLGVVLDVVYNHLGPDGNYLGKFSSSYFTRRYANEWGDALNFDGPHSHGVREFFIENARYWIESFHLDGLRLDATQSIHDAGDPHILSEISLAARNAAGSRGIVLIGENEPQDVRCLRATAEAGFGLDGLWNDDFHHSARVAATGSHHGYFDDYRGTAQELLSAVKNGFLYQGQYYRWQKKRRGTPVTREPAAAFVVYTQNHDQVANTFDGRRPTSLTSPAMDRALTALLLLGPETPLLFMGQEFGASTPFPFFADHGEGLRHAVREGRSDFLAQFPAFGAGHARQRIPDPAALATFESAKLRREELGHDAAAVALHTDLLRLRREDALLRRQDRFGLEGATLCECAFVLRWRGDAPDGDRLLVLNFGPERELDVAPEPLLAPPAGQDWQRAWDSEDPLYGGMGAASIYQDGRWHLRPQHASFWRSVPEAEVR